MATAEEAARLVDKLYQRLVNRRPSIEKQFNYFEGKQPLAYATEAWKKFHEDRYRDFADNWCGVVARTAVDRQRIDGFRLGGPTDILTADEQELWRDWNRNDLEAQSSQGFLAAAVAKRSAVIVWGNDDDEPEVSWEHPAQVIVEYDPTGRTRRAALKAWQDGDTEFATLYLPDGLYKFQRPAAQSEEARQRIQDTGFILPAGLMLGTGGGWRVREVSNEKWPVPNPLREVPVVEWVNRPLLGGDPISDIEGTMAMQDAINTLWAYLFTAADHASMSARVVLGAEPPRVPVLDENGQVVSSKPAKLEDLARGRLLFLPGAGANARIDQWDAAKLDVFGNEIARALGHVAAQTQTPGYYLLTNEKFANLNGDALTAADVPLVDKLKDKAKYLNTSAKETARLMALVRGKADLAAKIAETNGRDFTQWKDEAMHSLSQVSDAATKDRSVGLSLRTVLERRYGMTEPEVERELQRIREEKADPVLAALVGSMPGGTGAGSPFG
ncbi:phage portal protein [Pimelobacter simplex]|uniref:phage portal protein n=1 Tax=Nocardioides simplex TaxID=2045 RepID=UPI0013757259|nr:phage portal protein [Pimelobacter simplex]